MSSLLPTERLGIMAAVEACGIDIQPWGRRKDGVAVANPEMNPQYCYEWSFGSGNTEPIALCVWHDSLKSHGNQITYADNLRIHAMALERRTEQPFVPREVVIRARSQAKRARKFDAAIQRAARFGKPIRLILLEGERRDSQEPGWDASSVRHRRVDDESWHLDKYDWNSGDFLLVRGPRSETVAAMEATDALGYIDQFSSPQPPDRRETSGSVYVRSSQVRATALRRSGGKCECCGERGFATTRGQVYLETHHVIPLGIGGPDEPWNVVALCPNDHRRAHFSIDRAELQQSLIQKLVGAYPESAPHWEPLLQAQMRAAQEG